MLGPRYARSPSVSSAEGDPKRRRERPRRSPSRERNRTRGRDGDREGGPHRRYDESERRRRSFSPLDDSYDYNPRRRSDHRHHASSRRLRSRSRSPPLPRSRPAFSRRSRSPRNDAHRRSSPRRRPHDSALSALEKNNPTSAVATTDAGVEKEKPNYAPTGLLAAETNTVNGIVLKYNEPQEARKPPARDAWRLFVFKGSDILDTVHLGERSCWLFGRERDVADFPIDHPSCSKQHAVIQFRFVEKKNEFGDRDGRVRPYIIDLDSANGTFVNKDKIPVSRYVELRDKDMLQFGLSTREYVLMLPPDSSS